MLKNPEDFIFEFPIKHHTNRDAESPALLAFIQNHPDISSLLDVGAHYAHATYAPTLRTLVKRIDGIDILPDPTTSALMDNYYVGNANTFTFPNLQQFDCVICVSVFEHCGLSTYTADHNAEVLSLFATCLRMAKKYVWVSFDIGQAHVTPGQHSPITFPLYMKMLSLIDPSWKITERFFYNQGAQVGHPWYEHKKRDVAFKVPYIDFIGNQSITVIELTR